MSPLADGPEYLAHLMADALDRLAPMDRPPDGTEARLARILALTEAAHAVLMTESADWMADAPTHHRGTDDHLAQVLNLAAQSHTLASLAGTVLTIRTTLDLSPESWPHMLDQLEEVLEQSRHALAEYETADVLDNLTHHQNSGRCHRR